jgi:ribosomal protein S18 acetylase RimI-like enzyme
MAGGGFAISDATAADVAEILALQKLAYESEARWYGDWTLPPLTQTLASLASEIQEQTVIKAMDEAVIVGSARGAVSDGVCRIGRLIVHPTRQGRGLGTALLRAMEARFPQARLFELFTGRRSDANIRLYRRCGYAVTGTRHLSDRVTLVDLRKQVDAARS